MGSLLVRSTFGEMEAGRFVLQSGKRSSENGFQTTFGLMQVTVCFDLF